VAAPRSRRHREWEIPMISVAVSIAWSFFLFERAIAWSLVASFHVSATLQVNLTLIPYLGMLSLDMVMHIPQVEKL
jgi:hypothetical protein